MRQLSFEGVLIDLRFWIKLMFIGYKRLRVGSFRLSRLLYFDLYFNSTFFRALTAHVKIIVLHNYVARNIEIPLCILLFLQHICK